MYASKWRNSKTSCIIITIITQVLANNRNTTGIEKVESFVVQLLQQKFQLCTLLLLNAGNSGDTFGHIVYSTNQDTLLIQVENQEFEHNFQNSTNKTISSKLQKYSDVHRFRDSCTVGLFLIPDFNIAFGDALYDNVKTWSSFIKKDEDYYIFATGQNNQTDNILKSSQLGMGIKLKILIQPQEKVWTTCFYCDFGLPTPVPVVWGQREHKYKFKSLDALFPDYSRNFWGKILKVGTPTGTRWLNEIRKLPNGTWTAQRGIYKLMLDQLMIHYNFTCEFFPSMFNGGTGTLINGTTWVGSVGNVVSKTADIGHVTGQTFSRNKVVGFTYPISYEMLTFTTGEPLPYFSWKAIFWPLNSDMWIGLGISIILVNFIIYIIIQQTKEKFDLFHIVAYTFASILEQDVPSAERLKANSFRAFVCFWLFFSLVVSTAYRSKLVSLLSFPNVENPPETFEELASSDYSFALQYLHGAAYSLLQTSPNPTYKSIFSRMDLEEDDVKCFLRVIGKRFVCISWSRIADFIFNRNLTDQFDRVPMKKASATTCFLSVGMVVEKRAVFLRNFNSLIIRSTDGGLIERFWVDDKTYVYKERREWERATNKTKHNWHVESSDALTNKHFRGSYYLLATGCVCGLTTFIWEFVFRRKHAVKQHHHGSWIE